MKKEELLTMVNEMKKIFETVRLVDSTMTKQFEVLDNGDIVQRDRNCYDIWCKERQCLNCVSAKVMTQKCQLSKFELFDGSVYSLIAKYIEVEGQPYVLELIRKIPSETMFSAFGKTELFQNIMDFSKTMYIDPLTKAYNRKFFEEQFGLLDNHCAVAFVDLDNFKTINDTFGHDAGDQALKLVVKIIHKNIRHEDFVIRYGGDEFLLSFAQMPSEAFVRRLKEIRTAVKDAVVEAYPDLKMTISVGGYYCNNCDRLAMVKRADKLCYEAKVTKDNVKVEIE